MELQNYALCKLFVPATHKKKLVHGATSNMIDEKLSRVSLSEQ